MSASSVLPVEQNDGRILDRDNSRPGPVVRRALPLCLLLGGLVDGSAVLPAIHLSALSEAPIAEAASVRQPTPTITVTSPSNGATVHSSTVTMTVAVKNFTLVPPVLANPPVLKVNQGHILWILDNNSNFVRSRDLTASLTHTWTNVSPGRHTLIAYLATSQHLPYPGTTPAQATVTVSPMPGVTAPVQTGGGSLNGVPSSSFGFAILSAILALALGSALHVGSFRQRRRRVRAQTAGAQASLPSSGSNHRPSRTQLIACLAAIVILALGVVLHAGRKT